MTTSQHSTPSTDRQTPAFSWNWTCTIRIHQ